MTRIKQKFALPGFTVVFGIVLFIGLCIGLHTAPDRLIGSAFCHQLPSRSPNHGFPFCFRCSGLFSGIFWGILLSVFSGQPGKLFDKKVLAALAASFLLFLLDIINTTEYIPLHWYEEKEGIRFLSSFPLGFMLVRIMSAIWFYFFADNRPQGMIRSFGHALFLPATAALSYLIIFKGTPLLLRCFGYFLACGSLLFLLILYSILIECIALLKNRSWQNRSVLAAALLIVLLQVCLLGGLHISFFPTEVFERIQ